MKIVAPSTIGLKCIEIRPVLSAVFTKTMISLPVSETAGVEVMSLRKDVKGDDDDIIVGDGTGEFAAETVGNKSLSLS